MKAAFFTYPSAFQNVGGGEILLLKVKEYVACEGVQVSLFDSWRDRIEQFQVLHIFGSVKDCLGLAEVARSRKVPIVITPLFWSDFRRAFHTEGGVRAKLDLTLRHAAKVLFPRLPSARRKLLLAANLVAANSKPEAEMLRRFFALPKDRLRVVPNGVDADFQNARPALFREKFGPKPFVLAVGRVEPRKNQLNLIRAVKGLSGLGLVLIGSPVSGHESYFERCQKEGAGFTTFIPALPHGDELMKSAYAACEAFALQGWFETPGLVAMEAAAAGARVAATRGGSTRDAFKDYVHYFDPANPADIRKTLWHTIRQPKSGLFKEYVLNSFTWDKIARQYIQLYQEVKRS